MDTSCNTAITLTVFVFGDMQFGSTLTKKCLLKKSSSIERYVKITIRVIFTAQIATKEVAIPL